MFNIFKNKNIKKSRSFSFKSNRTSYKKKIYTQIISATFMFFLSIRLASFIIYNEIYFDLNIYFREFITHLQASVDSVYLMIINLFYIILLLFLFILILLLSLSSIIRFLKTFKFLLMLKKPYN